MKAEQVEITIKVNVIVSLKTAFLMRIMGRYPSAIIAKAIAEKIRNQ